MDKNKILAKFNLKIKDYNNELEKILENKFFSYDVKNLLLSMLYKIENAYTDYKTAKVEVFSKNEYIENILRIVQEKCLKIFLAKPGSKETEELENSNIRYKIDKENGEIICFPNELTLLTAIFKIDDSTELIKESQYEYTLIPLNIFIKEGRIDSLVEVLRDFNGWSWDIDTRRIRNFYSNFIYNCLLLLNGKNNFWDIYSELYKEATCVAMREYIYKKVDKKFNTEIKKIKKIKESRLNLFDNKYEFLNTLTDEKKKCTKTINKIDKLLNNKDLLKKEYYARNDKLPNKEKIFSISYLVKILEKERQDCLEKIEENNRIILPKEFVKEKTKLEKEVKFLNSIFEENSESTIIELSKTFLKSLMEKIEKINEENKSLLVKYIYKVRYFRYIPIEENKYIRDLKELNPKFKQIVKLIIKKAQELRIWEKITVNEEITYEILKEVFDTKIIKIENLNIVCREENNNIIVEYYDDTILENSKKIKKTDDKIKKRIKLFI